MIQIFMPTGLDKGLVAERFECMLDISCLASITMADFATIMMAGALTH